MLRAIAGFKPLFGPFFLRDLTFATWNPLTVNRFTSGVITLINPILLFPFANTNKKNSFQLPIHNVFISAEQLDVQVWIEKLTRFKNIFKLSLFIRRVNLNQ